MYEHNALGYRSGLALCLKKVRSSRARCPATALLLIIYCVLLSNSIQYNLKRKDKKNYIKIIITKFLKHMYFHLSRNLTKLVFSVSIWVQHKSTCTVIDGGLEKLVILNLSSKEIVLSVQQLQRSS